MAETNERMTAVWDGAVGQRWAADRERYDRMLAPFGAALMTAAAIDEGSAVLDVGCGFGSLSLSAAAATGGNGSVLGVDLSGPMLQVATARAIERQMAHAVFRQADAQSTDFGRNTFDVIVSQFGVMFFDDAADAFANLTRALRPGGRVAFTCWQDLSRQEHVMAPLTAALDHVPVPDFDANDWSHAAFSLADPSTIHSVLASAGLQDVGIQPVVASQYLGADVADVLAYLETSEFGESVFARADAAQATAGWNAVASVLDSRATSDGVYLDGAAWLVTATSPTMGPSE